MNDLLNKYGVAPGYAVGGGVDLPSGWENYSAADKIDYFNEAGVTQGQLAAAGVSQADINWMMDQGYQYGSTAFDYGDVGGGGGAAAAPTTTGGGMPNVALPGTTGYTTSGPLTAGLPSDWGSYNAQQKINYFNQHNITPQQLRAEGVPQADLDWMLQQGGYAGDTIAPGSNRYVQNVKEWFEERPNATYQDIQDAIAKYNLDPNDVRSAMKLADLSVAAQFAAFNPKIGSERNVDETYGGLKGLSSNINFWLRENPDAKAEDIRQEMVRWGLSDADFRRATGRSPEEFRPELKKQPQLPVQPGGGSHIPTPVVPPPQAGPVYPVTPAPLYQVKLPYTDDQHRTIYPNYIQTPQGAQPTYFPTSWWTGSPSASLAYGMAAQGTAPDFQRQMEEYRRRFAPQYYMPAAPPPPPSGGISGGGGTGAPAAPSGSDTPNTAPAPGYIWQRNPVTQQWEQVPDPTLQAARGGAVSELWGKYHG